MFSYTNIVFVVLLCSCLRSTAFLHHRYVAHATSTPSRPEKIKLPIETQRTQGVDRAIRIYAGKGFGRGDTTGSDNQLARTTAQQSKEVVGSYSKLLSKQAKKFEDMKKSGGQPSNDIYARLKGSEFCWFIGKLAYVYHYIPCRFFP